MSRCRMVFSGSGGQGVITASVIFSEAAVLHDGLNAVQSQSYGPEARGGATRADVVLSDAEIRYPKVIRPNVLVSLTQEAYNSYSPAIRPGGLLLTDSHFVTQERKVDARQIELPMYKSVVEKFDNPVVLNICMLGAVVGLVGLVQPSSVEKVLEQRVPSELMEINRQALHLGLEMAQRLDIKWETGM
ncbi:2-oxoacid:acceptor oxidoreductase family protein [Thermodesulfobacteriota bacterium]